jgi:hypothetical protein
VNTFDCNYESKVVTASVSAIWSPDLQNHVASCASCREVLDLRSELQELDETESLIRLPPAGEIWWRAQLIRAQLGEQKINRVLTIAQAASYVSLSAGFITWSIWHSSGFQPSLTNPAAGVASNTSLDATLPMYWSVACVLVVLISTLLLCLRPTAAKT